MQTPKVSRNSSSETPQKVSPRTGSSEVSQKISPRASSADAPQKISPRVVRQLRTTALDSGSASSSNIVKTPKERSPKITERRSPRSPISEVQKKRPSRVSELESQISHLQSDLKKLKDQLASSEAWKKQAQHDAEESKKQLAAVATELEESQKQLLELSATKEVGITELLKATEEQEQNQESELESIHKQQLVESVELSSALNEITELKVQLEAVADSEASHAKHSELARTELQTLKGNLSETILLVEDMKNQLKDCKDSEAQAQALVAETLLQLELAKKTVETLRSDGNKAIESYNAIASELDQSRARVNFLETLVRKLKADIQNAGGNATDEAGDSSEHEKIDETMEAEVNSAKLEIQDLKSALEAAEIRYKEEETHSAAQIKNAYELVEQIKYNSSQREADLEKELKKSKAEIDELKANLMDKETELQGICEENECLNLKLENTLSGQRECELEMQLHKLKSDIECLKANLMDKETELQNIVEENEMLKLEVSKKEINGARVNDQIVAELEAAKAAEREALMKLGYMSEEADKSKRKVARVSEQLEAAQAANSETEAELRRLKVQSDQWRKAAEAAASMLSTGNNGKIMERTGSMDSHYSPRTGKFGSPYSEDNDDDLLKKKNANMLKRIGVLWKKPQK